MYACVCAYATHCGYIWCTWLWLCTWRPVDFRDFLLLSSLVTEVSLNMKPTISARIADQQGLGTLLCLPHAPSTRVTGLCHHVWLFFNSRNILIKIDLFQETPTACPSVKENHNRIENLPYGHDLTKINMQTLQHNSQVWDSNQILLMGPWGTQIDNRAEGGPSAAEVRGLTEAPSSKVVQSEAWF